MTHKTELRGQPPLPRDLDKSVPRTSGNSIARIAALEAQLQAAEKRKAKDAALLSGFVDALEAIAGSSSLTATPKQFAVHLQRIAKNSLLAAAKALGEK